MKHYYYPRTHDMIKLAVLDMFNDMTIYRYHDETGEIINTFKVPITFGPIEKTHQFRKEQESGEQYYLTLPRMAITFNGTIPAPTRSKSSNTDRLFFKEDLEESPPAFIDYEPVPTDYVFTVYIKTEFFKDYAQIVENIIPYFSPDRTTLVVKEFSFLEIARNLKVSMTAINSDWETSFSDQNMRELNGSFTLTVEGYAYRPVEATGLIQTIDIEYFSPEGLVTRDYFSKTDIVGYATSASMPVDTDSYATSGINSNGTYYTVTHTEGN